MEVITEYKPCQPQFVHMDLEQQLACMDLGGSYFSSKVSTWDKVVPASPTTGWDTWPESSHPQIRDQIHHRFTEFDDPTLVSPSSRSSVVYLYIPFDCIRCLEDKLLSPWYTLTFPTKIVRKVPNPIESLGLSPSRLAKKEKLCLSA